jgi:replication factor A1
MKISELQAKQGNVEILAEVVDKEKEREFEKFGKKGKVCNAMIKDATGSVKLTLWNEQIEQVNVGDTIKVSNGWVSEWQGEKQLSTGKFGKLELVKKGIEEAKAPPIITNDPRLLSPTDKEEPSEEEFIDDELE